MCVCVVRCLVFVDGCLLFVDWLMVSVCRVLCVVCCLFCTVGLGCELFVGCCLSCVKFRSLLVDGCWLFFVLNGC